MGISRDLGRLNLALVSILLILSLTSIGWAATYYVDATNGNDASNGLSTSTAWKTIAKVNSSRFSQGDQILFKRGEIWRETLIPPSSGSASAPIIFGAYASGNKPVISGTNRIMGWTAEAQLNTWRAIVPIEPKIVLFNSVLGIKRNGNGDLKAANQWYWAANTLYLYSTSNPDIAYSEAGVQAGARDLCVYASKDYITLQNLTLWGSNFMGIQFYNAKHNVMDGIDVIQAYFSGVDNNGGPTDFTADLIIKNGEFSYCGAGGIMLHGDATLDKIHIENNTAHHNGWNNVNDNYAKWASGIKVWGGFEQGVEGASTNVIIEGNICYSNLTGTKRDGSGKGIWVDEWGSGAIVRYNKCYDNESDGIMIEHTDGAEVYYNIVYGNGSAYAYADGITLFRRVSNSRVYNNTVYNNRNSGISVVGGIGTDEDAMVGNFVINNISVRNGDRQLQCTYGGENAGSGRGNVYSYNCFGAESGSFIEWGSGVTKNTYASWETAYGSNTYSIKSDPLFLDAGTDFHLRPLSPCVNAGLAVGLLRDYEGTPLRPGGQVDVGALAVKKRIITPTNLKIVLNLNTS